MKAADSAALTGLVTSEAEGKMEGVLVSAKRPGSTITVTVVSNKDGRYAFPAGRLSVGQYELSIRATGYDMVQSGPNRDRGKTKPRKPIFACRRRRILSPR